MYFPKRIAEPEEMGDLEFQAFDDESKKSYKRWIIPLVDDALAKKSIKKGRILDVACGPGQLTKEFAKRLKGVTVTGIDTSLVAVKMAKENCIGLANTEFLVGDATKLPFKDETFDLVVCKDSMHHFTDVKKVLKEMVRVLKKDGILYVQDLRRDVPMYLLKIAIPRENMLQKLQYYSTRAAYTKEELSKMMDRLSLGSYHIATRKITGELGKKYAKLGIDMKQLRAGFQSRYVAVIKR